MKLALIATAFFATACVAPAPSVPTRAMDEVPVQRRLPGGEREYLFANGCAVVLQPDRAVVKSESDVCGLYQRDIALLYASAD